MKIEGQHVHKENMSTQRDGLYVCGKTPLAGGEQQTPSYFHLCGEAAAPNYEYWRVKFDFNHFHKWIVSMIDLKVI